MMKTLRRIGVAPALAAALLWGPVAKGAEIIEQVLVKVNGDIFTKSELEARQIAALRQLGRDVDPDAGDAQLRKMLDEVTPQLIVNVVDEMLLVQRGRDQGYRLTDERFSEILTRLKEENEIKTDEQFQAALKAENMTLADLRRNLERTMIVGQVQQNEVLGKIAISDEEARAYYDSHLEQFTTAPTVTLREILVSVPGDGATLNVGADEEARGRAAELRKRVLSGESFEKLASESSDAPSRANAGLIGPLSVSELSADLVERLETLKPGDVTELLRTPRGYQLLKLEARTAAETMPFDQAREQIGNRVFTDKRQQELDRFMDRLRAEAIIEWKNPELRNAYERGLAQMKESAAQRPS